MNKINAREQALNFLKLIFEQFDNDSCVTDIVVDFYKNEVFNEVSRACLFDKILYHLFRLRNNFVTILATSKQDICIEFDNLLEENLDEVSFQKQVLKIIRKRLIGYNECKDNYELAVYVSILYFMLVMNNNRVDVFYKNMKLYLAVMNGQYYFPVSFVKDSNNNELRSYIDDRVKELAKRREK